MSAHQSHKHKDKDILSFFSQYQRENGYPPTIREVGESVGINSTSVVTYHLQTLVSRGQLRRGPAWASRSYSLCPDSSVGMEVAAAIAQALAALRDGSNPEAVLREAAVAAMPRDYQRVYRCVADETSGAPLLRIVHAACVRQGVAKAILAELETLGLVQQVSRLVNGDDVVLYQLSIVYSGEVAS